MVNGLPCKTRSLLGKNDFPRRGDADRQSRGDDERQQRDQHGESYGAVDDPFQQERPGHLGRRPKDKHGAVSQRFVVWPRHGGPDEVRTEPGFHALGLAGLDGTLDLVKFHAAKGQKHSSHTVAVNGGNQVGGRAFLEINSLYDLHLEALGGIEPPSISCILSTSPR